MARAVVDKEGVDRGRDKLIHPLEMRMLFEVPKESWVAAAAVAAVVVGTPMVDSWAG